MKNIIVSILTLVIMLIVVFGTSPVKAQPLPATYCCDSWHVRRCSINPSFPGSSCYCYGQGYGYACY